MEPRIQMSKTDDEDCEIEPVDDLFKFDEDPVDYESAESFPASDPPPPQRGAQ